MKLILLLIAFPFIARAMCEYPHNPPVVCIKGTVENSALVKLAPLKCKYSVKVSQNIRPAGSYRYNDNLDLITFKGPKNLEEKILTLYSDKGPCVKKGAQIKTMAIYNCSDLYKQVPDMVLIDQHTLKKQIEDRWNSSERTIDCQQEFVNAQK